MSNSLEFSCWIYVLELKHSWRYCQNCEFDQTTSSEWWSHFITIKRHFNLQPKNASFLSINRNEERSKWTILHARQTDRQDIASRSCSYERLIEDMIFTEILFDSD